MGKEVVLELKEVSKTFGGLKALREVSFKILEGEIVGLIGPNGSGKTTLLNVITGFLPLTSGLILHEGKLINGLRPNEIVARGIARTFQITSIFPNLTVVENIVNSMHLRSKSGIWGSLFQTKAYKCEESQLIEEKNKLLGCSLGLQGKGDVVAKNLALGEQRNLELTIALATKPQLLLLDEPAAGLNQGEILELVKLIDLLHEQGISILIIEHNMRLVMEICTHLVVLNYGEKIAEGTPKEIAGNERVVAVYLGGSQERACG